jgi:hypothetical protein
VRDDEILLLGEMLDRVEVIRPRSVFVGQLLLG